MSPEPPRILVVAPHPDDEVIGCGGVIWAARRAGTPVTVVLLTLGEAQRDAPGPPVPEVQRALGRRRRAEALEAAHRLGLEARHVLFLGYPDGGLLHMWQAHPDAAAPYRSPHTGWDAPGDDNVRSPRARYCAAHLLGELVELLDALRPTDVFVPHSLDLHGDHLAAEAFVREALARARWTGVHLHHFLVHHPGWPQPHTEAPELPLLPPAGLESLGFHLHALPPEGREAKREALGCHRSQEASFGGLLRGFVRAHELCIEPLPAVAWPPRPEGPATAALYRARGPLTPGRVRAVDVVAGGPMLLLQVQAEAEEGMEVQVSSTATEGAALSVRSEARAWRGSLRFALPAEGWRRLAVMVETRRQGRRLDRTGYLRLHRAQEAP